LLTLLHNPAIKNLLKSIPLLLKALLIFFAFTLNGVMAQDHCPTTLALDPSSRMLIDAPSDLDFPDILTTNFTIPYKNQSLGLIKEAIWIKTPLNLDRDCESLQWNLVFGTAFHDFIDLYIVDGDQLLAHYALGDRRATHPILGPQRKPTIPLAAYINQDTSTKPLTLYIRIASQNALIADLSLMTDQAISADEQPILILSAFIAATLFLLGVLSLILLGITLKIALTYYFIMLVSYSFVLAAVYGWLNLTPINSDPWLTIAQAIIALSFLLLSNTVLKLDNLFTKTYRGLLVLNSLNFVFACYSAFIDELQLAILFSHLLGSFSMFMIMLLSILLFKTSTIARLYVLIFGFMALSLILRTAFLHGLLPSNFITNNLFALAGLIQLTLLFYTTLSYYFLEFKQLLTQKQQLKFQQEQISQRKLFLRLLAHELMTPLAISDAAARNLIDDIELECKSESNQKLRNQLLNDITIQRRALKRMQELVQQCLVSQQDINRFSDGETSLKLILTSIEHEVKAMDIDNRVILNTAVPLAKQPQLIIKGDHQPLLFAMKLILNNALKYSPEQQKVELAITLEPLTLLAEKAPQQLVIEARDYGIGFDHSYDTPKPFKRGSNTGNTSGLGIGLHIAQDIVSGYHGQLIIERMDQGSRVSLMVPVYLSNAFTTEAETE